MRTSVKLALGMLVVVSFWQCVMPVGAEGAEATLSISATIVAPPLELDVEELGEVMVVVTPKYAVAVMTSEVVTIRVDVGRVTLEGAEWINEEGERLAQR